MSNNYNNGGFGTPLQPNEFYTDGTMYVGNDFMNDRHIGGTYKGGQWRHFTNINPNFCGGCGLASCNYCGTTGSPLHHPNHQHYGNADETTKFMMRYHGGNYAQLQNLKKIVSDRKAEKVVYIDFDGIFSATQAYNTTEKALKTAQFSARYAIEMLVFYGFKVYVITGDESSSGRTITTNILSRIPVDSVTMVSGEDKFIHMSSTQDITKVFYIGDDLFDLGMCAGRRTPIFMTTANAMYVLKNMAHYVSLSSSHDYSVFDIASAILGCFGIESISYAAKSRRNSISKDIKANKEFEIGRNIAFTENSQMWVSTYLPILVDSYDVDPNDIGITTPYIQADDRYSLDDIYIATDMEYFVTNFAQLRNNRTYLLLPTEIDLTAVNTVETLVSLNKLLISPFTEWCLLTDHLSNLKSVELYNFLMEKKLYNLLSATTFIEPQI